MIGDNLKQYTYEYLINLALSLVPDDQDKRQGSVIYDALAPFCQILAAGALQLRNFYSETYAATATGEDLDNRVAEQGLVRYEATKAVKKIELADENGNPMVVPLGCRFSTMSSTNPVNYTVTAQYAESGVPIAGAYEATCEELGIVGNEYSGAMINITFIQGLASANLSSVLVPARDEEKDDELRQRYFETLNQRAFGGNVADYRTKVKELGAGAVQVYPTWDGGGTVKLSIVDPSYSPCSSEFVSSVQESVDPQTNSGKGIGLAPIGHHVTVVTPTEVAINVSADIVIQNSYSLGQIETAVNTALEEYIHDLRESWADADLNNEYRCDVYVAKITAALIAVVGIANVQNVKLNGVSQDISLTQTAAIQELPKLGEVTLNV